MVPPEVDLLKSWFPWTSAPLIVGAPMRSISGPKLTAAVHAAGGVGFLGIGYELAALSPTILTCQTLIPSATTTSSTPLPFGVGFLTWNCSITTALSHLLSNPRPPCAIWLFGCRNPNELTIWATSLKSSLPQTLLFYQAGSISEVDFSAQLSSQGDRTPLIDAIVIQGVADSGGHGLAKGASIMTLLPEAIDHISNLKRTGKIPISRVIPILAAGGIMDSRGATAALALGAHGIVLGTRLIATPESEAHEKFKELLVSTSDGGQHTVRTRVYDEIRGTGGWPEIFGGRAIANKTYEDHENGVPRETIVERYNKAVQENDFERITAFAGTGVGLIHEIRPAKEIVEDVRHGTKALLSALPW
ncbi:putative oxidoreductase 2-nitropropane dioxygenase family [Terfezia boudieri ATCC MYA-4762]|uniref:Putative oxidoreductase 2-nitropropane dioxygenase family n=1 Tax=Terfezia boudieri ATCC MYA-4762 TaxID=1051890 RepID=A0A3N4LTB4_9PEZI|nr:putative oxidoreductase 2-nitropropane dioxygenase family [Terfezia boudieri ATCC MYA-4762]